jgi:hypothetical protein
MLIDLEDAHAFHVSTFGGLSPFGIHEGVALRLSASTRFLPQDDDLAGSSPDRFRESSTSYGVIG